MITADLVSFEAPAGARYDRVVSVECFEHMKVGRAVCPYILGWTAECWSVGLLVTVVIVGCAAFD